MRGSGAVGTMSATGMGSGSETGTGTETETDWTTTSFTVSSSMGGGVFAATAATGGAVTFPALKQHPIFFVFNFLMAFTLSLSSLPGYTCILNGLMLAIWAHTYSGLHLYFSLYYFNCSHESEICLIDNFKTKRQCAFL